MYIPSYLTNRNGIFYFRRAIPLALRPMLGKREVIISLRTRDPREAIHLSHIVAAKVEALFSQNPMTKKKSNTFKTSWVFKLDHPDGTSETREVTPQDIAAMKDAGMSPEQISDVLQSTIPTSPPLVATGQQASALAAPQEQQGTLLSKLIEEYDKSRIADHSANWIVPPGDTTKARRLIEILGDVPCTSVTREHARSVKQQISKLPGGNTGKTYNDLTVPQILGLSYEKTMSATNVGHYMAYYSGLFGWAQKEEITARNPFDGHTPKQRAPEKPRAPFTREEVEQIFSGDMFTRYNPKKHQTHQYWAPLIALFTGARNAEIGALTVDDIYKEKDSDGREIWIIDINEDSDTKRTKTRNGIRAVPMHPTLVKLGLPSYRAHLAERNKKRLFEHLTWQNKSGYGRRIGEHFTAYLKRLGLHVPNKKVFYSFRHTIATALERADVPIHQIERLSGRDFGRMKTTGERSYITPREVKDLYDVVTKVDYTEELANVRPYLEMTAR